MAVLMNYGVNTNLYGINGFARQYAAYNGTLIGIYTAKVAAANNITLTVPSVTGNGALANNTPKILAIFGYQQPSITYVAINANATPNATSALVATGGILAPTALTVNGGDVINVYATSASLVSIELFSIT